MTLPVTNNTIMDIRVLIRYCVLPVQQLICKHINLFNFHDSLCFSVTPCSTVFSVYLRQPHHSCQPWCRHVNFISPSAKSLCDSPCTMYIQYTKINKKKEKKKERKKTYNDILSRVCCFIQTVKVSVMIHLSAHEIIMLASYPMYFCCPLSRFPTSRKVTSIYSNAQNVSS